MVMLLVVMLVLVLVVLLLLVFVAVLDEWSGCLDGSFKWEVRMCVVGGAADGVGFGGACALRGAVGDRFG